MTLTLPNVLFCILAAVTGLSAVAVVITQNIVRAATWLLFALAGTAGIFFLLGADFIGATQLLIYVGGTLVLVVFGVMLTAQGPFINMKTNAAEWALGLAVGLVLYGVLAFVLAGVTRETTLAISAEEIEKEEASKPATSLAPSKLLGGALLGVSQTNPERAQHDRGMTGSKDARNRPRTLMSYLLPFEIISVHLLVVLVGAAYLARAKRRKGSPVAPAPGDADVIGTVTPPSTAIQGQ